MATAPDPRPDAVTELVRVLRDQVTHHAEHIADLESRLTAANQRIAEQHRLLAQLLEKGVVPASGPHPGQAESHRDRSLPHLAAPELAYPPGHDSRAPMVPAPRHDRAKEKPRPARTSAPVRDAVTIVRDPSLAERDHSGPPPRPRVPAGRPIRLTVNQSEVPQIGAIAGVVLRAREHVSTELAPSNQPRSSVAAYAPTTGVVRSSLPDCSDALVETTLTLNREELQRGHERLAARRWWFPFRR